MIMFYIFYHIYELGTSYYLPYKVLQSIHEKGISSKVQEKSKKAGK